ncbi:MAG: ligase-associated DNA damage response endonuclease PdeM [Cyclobacteriaceae bacterium]
MNKIIIEGFKWSFGGEMLKFLNEKAIWIENEKTLLLADTHFGKAGHFRKAGIPVPENIHLHDYIRLDHLIHLLDPVMVVFLGDLFHSEYNTDWETLNTYLTRHPQIDFHLVKGNHDILNEEKYLSAKLILHHQRFNRFNFIFTHEPLPLSVPGKLNICGHFHPGITLKGRGKQGLKLPCYFYRDNCLILPAFGSFTGLMNIGLDKDGEIYAVTGQKVIPIKIKNKVG